jgi:hypothetical protein
MTPPIGPFELTEEQAVRAVAARYQKQGYKAFIEPSANMLPKPLRRFRPDVLARRSGENVFVEVKSRFTLGQESQLADVVKTIETMPGWHFELIVANPEVELSMPLDEPMLPKKQILKRLDEAEALNRNGHKEAAILLAWSAGEAALRHAARACGLKPDGQSAMSLAKTLYSLGGISKRAFESLSAALDCRNNLAHGFSFAAAGSQRRTPEFRNQENYRRARNNCRSRVSRLNCRTGP